MSQTMRPKPCVPNHVSRPTIQPATNKLPLKQRCLSWNLGLVLSLSGGLRSSGRNSMKVKMFWKELTDDLNVLPSVWKENTTPEVFLEQAAENNLGVPSASGASVLRLATRPIWLGDFVKTSLTEKNHFLGFGNTVQCCHVLDQTGCFSGSLKSSCCFFAKDEVSSPAIPGRYPTYLFAY